MVRNYVPTTVYLPQHITKLMVTTAISAKQRRRKVDYNAVAARAKTTPRKMRTLVARDLRDLKKLQLKITFLHHAKKEVRQKRKCTRVLRDAGS